MPGRLGDTAGPTAAGHDEAPVWFDGPAFAEGAKTHFIRLQAAWDQSDFRDIREYTSPQLFAELQRERQRLGESPQFTEVVRLDAELLGVQRDRDLVVASVAFSGLIREEEDAPAHAFREIWHVQHAWDTRDGDWLIAGIQQVQD
jgi:predicted lipid-binding transport protein (Tim44 family)